MNSKLLLSIFALICTLSISAFGQTNGDYRSIADGNWSSASIWEIYNDGWQAAAEPPSGNSGTITISVEDTVTVDTTITINGANIVIDGYLKETAVITKTAGTWVVNGVYEYNHVVGTSASTGLPTATWNTGSTCLITGITSSTSNLNGVQDFYNLVWNCSLQSGNLNLGWNTGTITVNGDIRVINTGTGRLQPCAPSANGSVTVNVMGNIIVDGSNSNANNQASFTAHGTSGANTSITVNVYGNVTVIGNPTNTGWTNFSISRGSQSGSGTTTWNFYGDVSVSYARIQNSTTTTSGGLGKFVFAKNGEQSLIFTNLDTNQAAINIEVLSGSTLNIGSSNLTPSSGFFILNDGAGIKTSHQNGLDGNLTNTGTKSLSINANYIFNGSTAQVTGTLLPAEVNDLTIDNSNGVSLSANTTVKSTLALTSGSLSIGSNTLTINGELNITGGNLVGGSTSNLVIGGTDEALELPEITLNNLTLDREDGLVLTGNVTVGGVLELVNGIIYTESSLLSIAQGGSVLRAGGYVIGTLQKYLNAGTDVPITLELGTSYGYTPVHISFNSVSSAGNFSGRIIEEEHPNIWVSGIDPDNDANVYWLFETEAGIGSYHGTLCFEGENLDPYADPSKFIARAFNGNMWSPLTVTGNTNTSIEISGEPYYGNVFAIGQKLDSVVTITATAGPNGTINPSGDVVLNYGDSQTFTITPDPGYQVDSVVVDDVLVDSTTSYTFINVTTNHTIRAVFSKIQYQIIATAGPNGTINPSGVVYVDAGADQEFLFTPDSRYVVDSVFVDGEYIGAPTSYIFHNVSANHTIRVTFAPHPIGIVSNGAGGGDWNSPSTWVGRIVPMSFDTVTILGTDSVIVGGSASCKYINIQAGGKLFISASEVLTVTGLDSLNFIEGTIVNSGSIASSGKLQFNNGGRYVHAQSSGSIPIGIWNTGSTCEVTGYTSGSKPGNLNQNFYNFTWNCSGQTANVDWGWYNNVIGGNVVVRIPSNVRSQMTSPAAGTPNTIRINGNIILESGQFASNGSSSSADITIHTYGNIIVTGGNFSVSRGSGPTVTWYLYGDFLMENASTQNSNSTGAKFVFAKSGVQALSLSNVTFVAGAIGMDINNGATVNISMSSITYTAGGPAFSVKGGGNLNIGSSVIGGSSNFTLDAGGTIQIAHPDGLNGCIVTTGTKSFSTDANYVFNGTTAQVTGNLMPDTVYDMTINNGQGLSITKNITVKGTLKLDNGIVSTGENVLIVAQGGNVSRTNGYVLGTLQKYIPQGASVPITFEIGTSNGYSPVDAEFINVMTAGNMSAVIVPGEHPDIDSSRINSKKNANQYWVFDATAQFESYNAVLNFVSADIDTGAEPLNFIAQAYNADNSPKWTSLTVANRTASSIEFSGLPSYGGIFAIGEPKSGEFVEETQQVPREFKLSQNYPNPFNPATTIEFTLPKDGMVTLEVYSLLGQKVATLFNGEAKAGVINRVVFNASNLASGIYLYRLEFGNQTMVRKLVLMK